MNALEYDFTVIVFLLLIIALSYERLRLFEKL